MVLFPSTLFALVFLILVLHYISDFVLQTHWQALNKSSDNSALAQHVGVYCLPFALLFGWQFAAITFVAHFLTDWNTSRITKRLWEAQDVHMFFVVIGFDQLLHFLQLGLTWLFFYGH